MGGAASEVAMLANPRLSTLLPTSAAAFRDNDGTATLDVIDEPQVRELRSKFVVAAETDIVGCKLCSVWQSISG